MRRAGFVVGTLCLGGLAFSQRLSAATLNVSDDDIDKIITSEYNAVKQYVPGTTLEIKDLGSNLSYGNGTIVIKRDFLRRYLAGADLASLRLMTRFLLAHELSHQLQYTWYGGFEAVAHNPDVSTRVVNEGQADILGAQYLLLSLNSEQPLPTTDAIIRALQLGFDIGEEDGDHPTPSHRRNGVRMGLAAGSLVEALLHAKEDQRYAESATVLRKKLYFYSSINDWSLRMAKDINHWHVADANLAVVAPSIDHSSNLGNVQYALTLRNDGSARVSMETIVQSIAFPRGLPHEGEGSELSGSMRHFVFIDPGAHSRISGTLPWVEDAQYESELIYPPDARALYGEIH